MDMKSSTTPRITRVIFSAGYEWDVRFVFGLCDRPRRLLVHIAHSAQKTDVNAPCCVALLCGVSSSCDYKREIQVSTSLHAGVYDFEPAARSP